MNEYLNNRDSISSNIANGSELPQTSQIADIEVEISPDTPSDDLTQKEPEGAKSTKDSSLTEKQKGDSENPLFTKLMAFLEYTLSYLSDLEKKYQITECDLTNELDNGSSQNKKLKDENRRVELKPDNLVNRTKYYPESNNYFSSTYQYNQPNHSNLQSELTDRVHILEQELQKSQEYYHQLENELGELQRSRNKLLAELSLFKRNHSTHYDGTSSRPQHHVLIAEYKNLKEQLIAPLALTLYEVKKDPNSEIKDPLRKEKINDIRAIISESILISGQTIMHSDRTNSIDSVTKQPKLDPDENLPSQVEESQIKSLNIESEFQYSTAGEWQERDFEQAYPELRDRFCKTLELDFEDLSLEIKTQIQATTKKILQFLNRAALADSPANFQVIEKGTSFDGVLHEAAKNCEDAGKIVKMIYPAYLVNNELKVRAIVLTEL